MKRLPIALIIASALLIWATTASLAAALRIAPRDAAPYLLSEVATEDNTWWYDAETWLSGLNGEVSSSESKQRLYWRKGKVTAEVGIEAPYAVRDTRPITPPDQPRMIGGRLAVSERFIRSVGTELLGTDFKVDLAESQLTRRIVIDPAYGGEDFGPRSVDQTPSKKAVLALAKVIAESFLREGFDVKLTRTEDVPLTSSRRAGVANNWNSDLFLSIQLSGDKRPNAKGFEVFYPPSPPPEIDPNRWDAAQKGVAGRSRLWAEEIRKAAAASLTSFDRGAVALPSPLLSAVECPAAILVVGNVGFTQEVEFLQNDSSRLKLADQLVAAAKNFLLH